MPNVPHVPQTDTNRSETHNRHAADIWLEVGRLVTTYALPAPMLVMLASGGFVDVRLPDDSTAAVDAWAAHLEGGPGSYGGRFEGTDGRPARFYRMKARLCGCTLEVETLVRGDLDGDTEGAR